MSFKHNAMGREAIEGLRFLASLPRAGAGREKTQPFNWIHSRLFIWLRGKSTTKLFPGAWTLRMNGLTATSKGFFADVAA